MSATIGPGIYAPPVRIVDATDNSHVAHVNALGQVAIEGTIAVTTPKPSTSVITRIGASTSSVVLLVANPDRLGGFIYNDSTSVMYLKLGTSASSTSKTLTMAPGSYYELPLTVYTGAVSAAWATATGNADVTETS